MGARDLTALPRLGLLVLVLPVLGLLIGCEPDRAVVAVLVADADGPRQVDLPALRDRVRDRCDGCVVEVRSADGDAERQADQLEAALAEQVDAVVLQPVDPEAAEGRVGRTAPGDEVPVVTWGLPVPGADLHVGPRHEQVGKLLAHHVVGAHGKDARVLLLGPPEDDPRAAVVASAARSALGKSLQDGATVDEVAADEAGEAEGAVAGRLDGAAYDVVLATTAEQADGAAAALADRTDAPALVGPDASLEPARRLVAGRQEMAVDVPERRVAAQVADVAVALLTGGEPRGGEEHEGVRSWLFAPRPVVLATLTDTLVRDGALTLEELCAGELVQRCRELGFR